MLLNNPFSQLAVGAAQSFHCRAQTKSTYSHESAFVQVFAIDQQVQVRWLGEEQEAGNWISMKRNLSVGGDQPNPSSQGE